MSFWVSFVAYIVILKLGNLYCSFPQRAIFNKKKKKKILQELDIDYVMEYLIIIIMSWAIEREFIFEYVI